MQLDGTLAATHTSWGSVAPSSSRPRSHNKCSRSHSRSNRPGVLVPPGPSAPVTHASPGKDRAPLDDSPAACEGPPGLGSSDPAEAAARALGARRVTPGLRFPRSLCGCTGQCPLSSPYTGGEACSQRGGCREEGPAESRC